MIPVFYAKGGPIWIKFCRLVQNDMCTGVWSKSKPDVRMADIWANSVACHPRATCHIAGAATWRIQCHDPSATCHIAGCCHQAISMACNPRATYHIAGCYCRVQEFYPPYWKSCFAMFYFLKCSLGFDERRLSYRLQYTCFTKIMYDFTKIT